MDAHERFLRLLLAHQEDLKAFIASMVRERALTEDLFSRGVSRRRREL